MKTLKTHIVEAILNYLYANDKAPHIRVNWSVLDQCNGEIPNIKRDADEIILNISSNSIANFDITSNTIYFNCRFGGVDTACVIPTASISAAYSKITGEGMTFNAIADYQEEQQNVKQEEKSEEITKSNENKVSHLRVVK